MEYYERLMSMCRAIGDTKIIGHTVAGYGIPLVERENANTLIVASVHAREHITTDFAIELFKDCDYPFDVVPCLDIDGVILAKYGAEQFGERRDFLEKVNGGKDFSLWKANLNAVDINVNFDAEWGKGKYNIRTPAPANYIGPHPESEPETRAIKRLIEGKKYSQVVCYHTKGEVVYWGFGNNFLHREEAFRYASIIGYRLAVAEGSVGGLKDWYDLFRGGLGLTVEIGEDRFGHPYPESELPKLVEKHKRSVEILYDNGQRVARKIYDSRP